jgi:hypothetical protein
LRCLALISLGRWQMSRLAGRVMPLLAAAPDRPVQVEFVLIRHAPQERGPHSPSRQQQGWRLLAEGKWEALARQALRCQVPGVRQGAVESGRSQTGRLLLVDLDSRLPNLALMKLSRHFKAQGRVVPIKEGTPRQVSDLDDRADGLLKELVRIVFRQNMKSMETYYRWLAIQYAARCGRIHAELIETLFRYNARAHMGRFVARLETLCRRSPGAGNRAKKRFLE